MNPLAAVSLLATFAAPLSFSWDQTTTKTLTPGVTLTQSTQSKPPLLVDLLTVDPKAPGVSVAPEVANDSLTNGTGDIRKGRENISALVARRGLLAAVNGDYFPYTGDPLGLGVANGEIYSEPYISPTVPGRAAIGWLPDGHVIVGIPQLDAELKSQDGTSIPITGVDRLTATDNPNDAVVTTSRFGPTSAGRGNGAEIVLVNVKNLPLTPGQPATGTVNAIVTDSPSAASFPPQGLVISVPANSPLRGQIVSHFHVGEIATVTVGLRDITPPALGALGGKWDDVRQAIGGGPILLRHGQVVVDDVAEGLGGAFSDAPHARTAVGVRSDGKILILTVDSGSPLSAGISLRDLAALLKAQGAVDAINLDGGGSTAMVAHGVTVSFPYGGAFERPVADMLTVSDAETDPEASQSGIAAPEAPTATVFAPLPANLVIGANVPLKLVSGAGEPISNSDILWNGPVGGVGFVGQDGVLRILHSGHGTIIASVKGERVATDITVGAPQAPVLTTPSSTPGDAEPPPSTRQ